MQTLFTHYKQQTEGLNRLAEQLAQREQLLLTLKSCLAPRTQPALLSAEIIDNTLMLATPSAAWATRLRFDAQKLMAATNNPNIRQYHIQIIAPISDINQSQPRPSAEKPSDEALIALKTLTDKLDPNDALKASMVRLLRLVSTPDR